jgi:hypothetical protein
MAAGDVLEVGGIIISFPSWARGAVGSAPDWQSGGQGFESPRVHQIFSSGQLVRLLAHQVFTAFDQGVLVAGRVAITDLGSARIGVTKSFL